MNKLIGFIAVIFAMPAMAQDVPVSDFLQQVFSVISGLGGLSWALKVSAIILLVVASMKVSILRLYVWDKLGGFKAVVAPLLGLAAGLIANFGNGQPLSLAGLLAYVLAGAGAIALHELLDALKGIPGAGEVYRSVIDFLMRLLGGVKP